MRRTGGLRVIAVAVACTLLGTLCAPATLAHDFAWSRVDLRLEPEILHLEMYFDAESLGDATGVPLPIRRLEEIPKPELITAYIASHVSVSRGNAGCPLVFSEARIDRTLGIHFEAVIYEIYRTKLRCMSTPAFSGSRQMSKTMMLKTTIRTLGRNAPVQMAVVTKRRKTNE